MDAEARLSIEIIDTYTCALRHGVFDPEHIARELNSDLARIRQAEEILLSLHLLTPGRDGEPSVPADPEVAEAELSAPITKEILKQQKAIARIHRQMHELRPFYRDRHRIQHEAAAVTTYENPADVRRELTAMLEGCRHEVLMMQPGGGRSHQTLRRVIASSLATLNRGVGMRTIYQHSARANLATRGYVRQVTAAGAMVRTTIDTFERLIVIDGDVAFVPMSRVGAEAPGAAIVSDPTVVGFMCRSFENLWESAKPFDVTSSDAETKPDEIHSAILALLAQGHKDETIARRLGIATRTCRRYIKTIVDELDASSRFQAGVQALHLGLVSAEERGNDTNTRSAADRHAFQS
ncbi:regulatory protein, luxR family [Amycolatopsis xylanica]|uniref:Regulatory protein, luxR family n=1 Tax=Amycolatopsis xylanica TaxID=589385 RepID=A0A1H3EZP7_9PSEU|nr:LuxR C-terminal-related transcriptional regulator [Amycolatopsis xylanica]SDX83374.1 regulatory protein, luxR family [Amycolatopsis xylanica]